MTAAATSTAAPALATASDVRAVQVARAAASTRRRVPFIPEVGRIPPGSRPERLERGQSGWRRWPNQHGGAFSAHPDVTDRYVQHGLVLADGRRAWVVYVEREAFVDVLHIHIGQEDST